MDTSSLLINFLLYVFLPLWGIAGFADWICHRHTKIEHTSGLIESLLHSLMGIQVGIPIALCLLFHVNVLVLLICFAAWILHEIVAHWDVKYASPLRDISIWEMHAHNYLATFPLYMLLLIIVINWQAATDLVTFNWAGNMNFIPIENTHGFEGYVLYYLAFMSVLCVLPYAEENLRCLLQAVRKSKAVL